MFDNQSSLSPWPLGTRQQCSWSSDCRDSAKRSECLQQARDKVKKKLQSNPDLENWGHGENDILFKGWRSNENYKPKTNRPQTLGSSSLLRRNKVRSKTSENKRQKIQFKEYSENNMYILKPRNCQTYFRDSDLSFIVQKYFTWAVLHRFRIQRILHGCVEMQNFFLRLKTIISQSLCSTILWIFLLKLKKLTKQTQSIYIVILGYFARVVLKLYLLII